MNMHERVLPTEGFDYRRVFPWVHVFRSIRLALRIRQLFLAALGLLLATGGMRLIDSLAGESAPADSALATDGQPLWPWEMDLGFRFTSDTPGRTASDSPADLVQSFYDGLSAPIPFLRDLLSNWQVVLIPVRDVLGAVEVLFRPESDLHDVAIALSRTAWWLLVWSVFGGAIARSAAVEFARDQSTHFWGALKFSFARALSYFASPMLPLGGIAFLGGLCALGGLTGRIGGGVGPGLLGLIWGPLLILALLLAIVVMGLACGWPLMVATISVEGTDGFDGMSRAYNYVYERPRYYIVQIALTMLNGSFGAFCVLFMAQLTLRLALCGVAWGGGLPAIRDAIVEAPPILAVPKIDWGFDGDSPVNGQPVEGNLEGDSDIDPRADLTPIVEAAQGGDGEPGRSPTPVSWSSRFTRFWMCLLATLVVGFVYSFFWSSATVIYFLLRRSVDGNDFDEVYLGAHSEPDELLPLVGASAMGIDLATIGSPSSGGELPPDNPPYPKPS